jgi:hypothetical protein
MSNPPLPHKAPPCARSQVSYNGWRKEAVYLRQIGKLSATFSFCTDCTPQYRDKMVALGRCRYPGTTFAQTNGVIVGHRET